MSDEADAFGKCSPQAHALSLARVFFFFFSGKKLLRKKKNERKILKI